MRLEMLEEAVEVIRLLWQGGMQSHRGRHYTRRQRAHLHAARHSRRRSTSPGFGPKAIDLAARIGDGYCTTSPDADSIERFRANGGERKTVQAGTKVCYGPDRAEAVKTAHRIWPNERCPASWPRCCRPPPTSSRPPSSSPRR